MSEMDAQTVETIKDTLATLYGLSTRTKQHTPGSSDQLVQLSFPSLYRSASKQLLTRPSLAPTALVGSILAVLPGIGYSLELGEMQELDQGIVDVPVKAEVKVLGYTVAGGSWKACRVATAELGEDKGHTVILVEDGVPQLPQWAEGWALAPFIALTWFALSVIYGLISTFFTGRSGARELMGFEATRSDSLIGAAPNVDAALDALYELVDPTPDGVLIPFILQLGSFFLSSAYEAMLLLADGIMYAFRGMLSLANAVADHCVRQGDKTFVATPGASGSPARAPKHPRLSMSPGKAKTPSLVTVFEEREEGDPRYDSGGGFGRSGRRGKSLRHPATPYPSVSRSTSLVLGGPGAEYSGLSPTPLPDFAAPSPTESASSTGSKKVSFEDADEDLDGEHHVPGSGRGEEEPAVGASLQALNWTAGGGLFGSHSSRSARKSTVASNSPRSVREIFQPTSGPGRPSTSEDQELLERAMREEGVEWKEAKEMLGQDDSPSTGAAGQYRDRASSTSSQPMKHDWEKSPTKETSLMNTPLKDLPEVESVSPFGAFSPRAAHDTSFIDPAHVSPNESSTTHSQSSSGYEDTGDVSLLDPTMHVDSYAGIIAGAYETPDTSLSDYDVEHNLPIVSSMPMQVSTGGVMADISSSSYGATDGSLDSSFDPTTLTGRFDDAPATSEGEGTNDFRTSTEGSFVSHLSQQQEDDDQGSPETAYETLTPHDSVHTSPEIATSHFFEAQQHLLDPSAADSEATVKLSKGGKEAHHRKEESHLEPDMLKDTRHEDAAKAAEKKKAQSPPKGAGRAAEENLGVGSPTSGAAGVETGASKGGKKKGRRGRKGK